MINPRGEWPEQRIARHHTSSYVAYIFLHFLQFLQCYRFQGHELGLAHNLKVQNTIKCGQSVFKTLKCSSLAYSFTTMTATAESYSEDFQATDWSKHSDTLFCCTLTSSGASCVCRKPVLGSTSRKGADAVSPAAILLSIMRCSAFLAKSSSREIVASLRLARSPFARMDGQESVRTTEEYKAKVFPGDKILKREREHPMR